MEQLKPRLGHAADRSGARMEGTPRTIGTRCEFTGDTMHRDNALEILEDTAHRETIEKLLRDDPRLISKHTTRQYRSDLLKFNAWRDDRPITKTLVEEYAAHLQMQGKAPNTINQRLAAIRWYARKIADLAADYAGDEQVIKHAARVATVRD